MRVGVVGTGFGRRVVAPVFAATEGCAVTDVVSARDEAAVRALAARDDVDLVCVHSPPFLHARDVGGALDAGKAVLCDKPFMVATEFATGDGVRLMNFEFRHQPARLVVRDALARIGRVEHVSWSHVSAGTRVPLRPYGWLFDATRGGGWIGAWASHAVDTLRWMFGEVEAVVDAVRHLAVPERDGHRCTAEDGLTATLRMANGATVAIDSTYAAPVSVPPRFTVFGNEGAIECVADERVTLLHSDGRREELRAPSLPTDGDRHDVAMRAWAPVVRDCVRTGTVPDGLPTFADGVACDAVLEQLRAAPLLH